MVAADEGQDVASVSTTRPRLKPNSDLADEDGFTCLALQQRRRLVSSASPSLSRREEPPQQLCCLTPGVLVDQASVSDLAAVFFSCLWSEGCAPGQMELPALLEGQVGLVGFLQLLIPPHQLDGDVRGVELGHMTNQHIVRPELCWVAAVDHHLGSLCRGRGAESVRYSPLLMLPSIHVFTEHLELSTFVLNIYKNISLQKIQTKQHMVKLGSKWGCGSALMWLQQTACEDFDHFRLSAAPSGPGHDAEDSPPLEAFLLF